MDKSVKIEYIIWANYLMEHVKGLCIAAGTEIGRMAT